MKAMKMLHVRGALRKSLPGNHIVSLFLVFKLQNVILQCNQACNTDHNRWYGRKSFIHDVETATFILMHPGKEKQDG